LKGLMGDSKEKGGKSTDELVVKWWEMTKDYPLQCKRQRRTYW
jgi:hypothetical protein